MIRTLRLAVAIGLLAALVAGTGSVAAGGPRKVLDARLVGLPTALLQVAGVTGAGHAWTLKSGKAKLFEDGRVEVNVHGLVLFPEGNQPAANVKVVVSCNGGGAGNIISSANTPLSQPKGDMHFNGFLTAPLPSPCLAPAIFVTSTGGGWFAVTGN